jgi:hypothetical protein
MSCSDVLNMIDGSVHDYRTLEILFFKWQPGGECIQAALGVLHNARNCSKMTNDPLLPALFTQIEAKVPNEERPIFTKPLLEADLRYTKVAFFFCPQNVPFLVKRWRSASKEGDWEEAKTSPYHSNFIF